MANKIVLKKSSVAAKVPTTSDLDYGELALNYADGKLYFKDATNAIKNFTSGSSTSAWVKQTSNYTAASGDKILADTSAGSFTITLPASPVSGDSVEIADGGDWSTNNLTVARNGNTIETISDDVLFDVKGASIVLIYDGSTWEVFATLPSLIPITDDTTTNDTRYLIFTDISSGALLSTDVSSSKLYFNPSSGTLTTTDYNSLSDIRYKDNIETIYNGGDVVRAINPVTFNWKDTGKKAYGVIAQEIEQVLPDIVSTAKSDIKTVSYDQIIPHLISAIKELQQEIDQLKKDIPWQ